MDFIVYTVLSSLLNTLKVCIDSAKMCNCISFLFFTDNKYHFELIVLIVFIDATFVFDL